MKLQNLADQAFRLFGLLTVSKPPYPYHYPRHANGYRGPLVRRQRRGRHKPVRLGLPERENRPRLALWPGWSRRTGRSDGGLIFSAGPGFYCAERRASVPVPARRFVADEL